jgi:DNA excision repair protein ERCC-5
MNDSDLSEGERLQLAVAEDDDQDEDDEALAFVIQASLDQKSKRQAANSSAPVASSSRVTLDSGPQTPKRQSKTLPASPSAASDDDFDDMYVTPSRLSMALRFAHSHHDSEQSARKVLDESPSGMFGMNALLTPNKAKPPSAVKESGNDNTEAIEINIPVEVAKGFEEFKSVGGKDNTQSKERAVLTAEDAGIAMASSFAPTGLLAPQPILASSLPPTHSRTPPPPDDIEVDESDDDMEEVRIDTSASVPERLDSAAAAQPIVVDDSDTDMEEVAVEAPPITLSAALSEPTPTPADSLETPPTIPPKEPPAAPSPEVTPITPPAPSVTPSQFLLAHDSVLSTPTNDSRSPSPQPPPPAPYSPPPPPREDELERDLAALEHEREQEHQEEEFDAADEMDAHAEEGQFAEFLSQVKGRDLHDVRREIDEEITVLNQQKKAALRDAEDVTQQMVSQIMVSILYFSFSRFSRLMGT